MKKKVSIVIPTYGRSDLISKAIESVINQSYANKEIVVIDDNVDDVISERTREVVLSFKDKIDIKYVKNAHNIGGALSRNEGINQSAGEYVSFLDDDDFFVPEKLSRQIEFMEKFNFEASLCDMRVIDENGNLTKKIHHAQCNNAADFLIRGVAMTPMLIVTKFAAIKAGLFENSVRFQDHIFIINLLKAGYEVGVLKEPLVYYYEHSSPRITNSNKSALGYDVRFEKEKELFPLLTPNEKRSVILRHNIIRSKIICAEKGSAKAVVFLFKLLVKVRNISDFVAWSKALARNVIKKNKRF